MIPQFSPVRVANVASEISLLILTLLEKTPASGDLLDKIDSVDMDYAEAILAWNQQGNDLLTYFQTDNPVFLLFRKQLQKAFALEILSPQEASIRNRLLRPGILQKNCSMIH